MRQGTGHPSANLLGNITVKFVNGVANFTDLAIDLLGEGYIIDFVVTSPLEAANMTQSQFFLK